MDLTKAKQNRRLKKKTRELQYKPPPPWDTQDFLTTEIKSLFSDQGLS